MVTTRAASRLATPRGEASNSASTANEDQAESTARPAGPIRERRRSADPATAEEAALLKELGVTPRPPETQFQKIARKASETLELLIIRAGATLLTPWERFLYALSVLALTVLVCVGMSKAVQFYAQSLQQVMQRGDP